MNNNIVWLIQTSGLLSTSIEEGVQALNNLKYPFKSFGVRAFTKNVTGLEDILQPNDYFILRSGTKLLNLLDDVKSISELNEFLTQEQIDLSDEYIQRIKQGIFYNVNSFDQFIYKDYDLPLLNSEAEYLPVNQFKYKTFNEAKFIKPSRDLKAFNAGIIEAGDTIYSYIVNQPHQMFFEEEIAVVAPLINLEEEYRFFVVNGEVITGSTYRVKDRMVKVNIDDRPQLLEIAKSYAKLYQPHEVFTMDIAKTKDGYKIIEYNCWNASGLYATNVEKIFSAIHEHMINKLNKVNKYNLSGGIK